jgi:uncharacterized protein
MKMKLFTHTDLDGVGCAIAMRSLFSEREGHVVDVSYCDYDKINEKVQKFLNKKEMEDYDFIFITDISVDEETAEWLDDVEKSDNGPFVQLIDHHGTAEWLNKYDWAWVEQAEPRREGHKSSGTSLIMEFFNERSGFEREATHGLKHFAETVRRYDTWEWTTHYNEVLPKELNDYLYMVGREKFANLMLATIPSNDPGKEVYFDVTARALLDHKQVEIKAYIEKKDKQIITVDTVQGHKVGIIFAEQHVSELGNELCKKHEELDYVAMIDMGEQKVSFRTVRDDINLGEIAKGLGGGGHPKAAGAQFEIGKVTRFLGTVF